MILKRNLEKTLFQVGDIVKWKKPRRNAPQGVIVDIQTKEEEVTWTNGGTMPLNIVVEVKRPDGIQERVKTNVKKINWVGIQK